VGGHGEAGAEQPDLQRSVVVLAGHGNSSHQESPAAHKERYTDDTDETDDHGSDRRQSAEGKTASCPWPVGFGLIRLHPFHPYHRCPVRGGGNGGHLPSGARQPPSGTSAPARACSRARFLLTWARSSIHPPKTSSRRLKTRSLSSWTRCCAGWRAPLTSWLRSRISRNWSLNSSGASAVVDQGSACGYSAPVVPASGLYRAGSPRPA